MRFQISAADAAKQELQRAAVVAEELRVPRLREVRAKIRDARENCCYTGGITERRRGAAGRRDGCTWPRDYGSEDDDDGRTRLSEHEAGKRVWKILNDMTMGGNERKAVVVVEKS